MNAFMPSMILHPRLSPLPVCVERTCTLLSSVRRLTVYSRHTAIKAGQLLLARYIGLVAVLLSCATNTRFQLFALYWNQACVSCLYNPPPEPRRSHGAPPFLA
jgi:hypothetical protein